MAYLNDTYIFDAGLAYLDVSANRLDICSQEPTTYGQATTAGTYSLGNKTSFTVGSPTDRTPNGRKVVTSAITDGTVTNSGTATHWAITNTGGSVLIATGLLAASQVVAAGNTFTLAAFDIGFPDAV